MKKPKDTNDLLLLKFYAVVLLEKTCFKPFMHLLCWI